MKKVHQWLGGLLVLQLVVAAGLFWQQQQPAGHYQSQPLFAIDSNKVDKVIISEGDNTLELVRTNGEQWQLPTLDNMPVDGSQLDTMIEQLNGLNVHWPVATTASSHERFEVNDDVHQRKITFYEGDKLVQGLFVGSSPTFRKAHIRALEQDAVYSVNLNAFDFPVDENLWLEKTVLALDKVTRVKTNGIELEKKDDQWTFVRHDFVREKPPLDEQKAIALAKRIETLRVNGIADTSIDLNNADQTVVNVSDTNNDEWQFTFSEKDGKFYVQRSDRDAIFTVSKPVVESFKKVDLASLAKENNEQDKDLQTPSILSDDLDYRSLLEDS